MPKTDAVCSLSSESEHEAREVSATPKESQGHPAKKRKVAQRPDPVDKVSELYLRSLLGKQCTCSKKTCLQQFIEPALFKRMMKYREHWFDLGKLDQDAFVPRPIFCR